MAYGTIMGQTSNPLLQSHINDKNNPHEVTTNQIGAATSTDLQAHIGNTSNPHKVTASQVGAIPIAEKGQPNGVAALDNSGKIPASQLPVIEAGVTSFNGRTGAVSPQNNDYTAQMVGAIGLNNIYYNPTTYFNFGDKKYGVYGGAIGNGGFIPLSLGDDGVHTLVEGLILICRGSAGNSWCGTIIDLENNSTYYPNNITISNEIIGDLSGISVQPNGNLSVPSTDVSGIAHVTLTYDSIPG